MPSYMPFNNLIAETCELNRGKHKEGSQRQKKLIFNYIFKWLFKDNGNMNIKLDNQLDLASSYLRCPVDY